MKYNTISIIPSHFLNSYDVLMSNNATAVLIIDAGSIISIIMSAQASVRYKGWTADAMPIDNKGSVIFEPINVPMATPWERLAAINAIVNSGNEVPNPETTVPIIEWGISIS